VIVAGVQMDIAWEDPKANLARADELVARAAGAGARLVVLPEMFATGFSMAAARVAQWAPAIREGLSEIAVRRGVWLLGGYAEPAEPTGADSAAESAQRKASNACSLVAPDGAEHLRFHKLHPFSLAGEHLHYAAGDRLPTSDVEGVRVTPLICYDLRFPEPFRAAADRTDLFAVIANWPRPRRDAWRSLLTTRAIENQVYVLGVNRVGSGDGQEYAGDSALVGPLGEPLANLSETEGLLVAGVEPSAVAQARDRFGFLADRRPGLYAKLTGSPS